MAHIIIVPRDPYDEFYEIFYINEGTKTRLSAIHKNFIPTAEWFYRADGLDVRIY
jgi:hypothetical protein